MTGFPMTALPPETDGQRLDRLERELAACTSNHALLRKGSPEVARNNARLRSGMQELIDRLSPVADMRPVVERLDAALRIPYLFEQELPEEFLPPRDDGPETPAERIAWLALNLRECGRANYLVQLAGARIVWNSDAMRAAINDLIGELSEAADDESDVHAVVASLKATLKAAAP
jgi:hypothetical protein